MGRLSGHSRLHFTGLALLVSAPLTAFGQQAHQHGVPALNIALQEQALFVELIVPLNDIVGFEHWPARNDAEQEYLDRGIGVVSDPRSVFSLTQRAKCKIKEVVVETPERGDNEGSADGDELGDVATETHIDLTITYRFKCKSPNELSQISVHLFRLFPDLQSIQASLVADTEQIFQELTFAEPTLFLPR